MERERVEALQSVTDRIGGGSGGGTESRLVTTCVNSVYPTVAGTFYASNPTEIDGSEIEGGTATYTADATQVMYVLNQGALVPPVGTRVIASSVGGRWVFRYDG